MEDDKIPIVRLDPIQIPGRTVLARELVLRYTVKVGRAVANKVKPAHNNAIFESKVLSRSHAEIWTDKGKVYIQDTKSSNGTYLDGVRLSATASKSEPEELKSGMELKLGVDVTENSTSAHKCVAFQVTVIKPGQTEEDEANGVSELKDQWVPIPALLAQGEEVISKEIATLRETYVEQQSTITDMSTALSEVTVNEMKLSQQLKIIGTVLHEVDAQTEDSYQDMLQEDKLLSRIDAMESQLEYYMTRYPSKDDEVNSLRDVAVLNSNNKHVYEMKYKKLVKRAQEEKAEVEERLRIMKHDRTNTLNSAETQLLKKEKEIDEAKSDKIELFKKIQQLQTSAIGLAEQLKEKESAVTSVNEDMATEAATLQQLSEEQHAKIEVLSASVESLRVDVATKDNRIIAVTNELEKLLGLYQSAAESEAVHKKELLASKTAFEALQLELADVQKKSDASQSEWNMSQSELEQKLKSSTAEMDKLQSEQTKRIQDAESAAVSKANAEAKEEATREAKKEADALRTQVKESLHKFELAERETASLRSKLEASTTTALKTKEEISSLTKKAKSEANAQVAQAKKIAQLETAAVKLKADVKQAHEATKRMKKEKTEINQKHENSSSQHKTLKQEIEKLEMQVRTAKAQSQSSPNKAQAQEITALKSENQSQRAQLIAVKRSLDKQQQLDQRPAVDQPFPVVAMVSAVVGGFAAGVVVHMQLQ